MKNSLETRLGIFVVLVVLAAWAIMETLGGLQMFQSGYRLNALFATAQDLKVGDNVKMAGVEIGRVESITLTNQSVNVAMKLRSGVIVKTDSKASVRFTGLMGQNFVSISFGSPDAPQAIEGTPLQTEEQPDLNAVMAKLNDAATDIDNVGRSFTGFKIDNLVGPLRDFMNDLNSQGGGTNLAVTLKNFKIITSEIASGQGTVGKLIHEDTLYTSALTTVSNLQDTAASAGDVLATAKSVMNDVAAGKGTIGKLVTDDTLFYATTAAMTNFNQILLKINQGQGSVGKLVNDQEFYRNAKLTLQKVDKAADSLEDQGPMSVIGIMANQFGL
jgi:phospholipid/cholesterol/gamma-HCH transport system substrate-binding protein